MAAATPVTVAPIESAPRTSDDGIFLYAFHSSRALPAFNGTKCIKNVLLSQPTLQRFNKLVFAFKRWLFLMHAAAYAGGISTLFARASVGRWLALVTFTVGFAPNTITYFALRYDLVMLVGKTFEFWYVSVVNLVCVALVIHTFHDWRGLMAIWSAIGYEVPFLLDAVHRGTAAMIGAAVMGAIADLFFIVTTSFDLIDRAESLVLYENHLLKLTSDVVIVNGLGTVMVLLLRNAYRKHRLLVGVGNHKTNASTSSRERLRLGGSCIMYRCRLELRATTRHLKNPMPAAAPVAVHQPPEAGSPSCPHSSHLIQLVFAESDKLFEGRVTVSPWPLSVEPWSRTTHVWLWLVAFISQVSLVLSNPILTAWLPHSLATIVAWLSITTATVFCGVYFAHCQRQLLLRELCGSFDFVFMSFQFTVAHWCICDMLQWETVPCLGVLSSWLWSHWLITLDAVTPVMKRKLGFHARGAICVDIVLLLQQITVASALFSSTSNTAVYTDHLLFVTHLYGHTKEIRIVPMFVWRNFTCFLWCARLLWRLVDRKGDELLVLQGQVQYDDSSRGKPGAGAAAVARGAHGDFNAVVPLDGK